MTVAGKTFDINVHYVTRVEGHGNIVVSVKDGRVQDAKFEVVESPRFFEAMLKGRRYDEAAHITSRICGICSPGHTTTSLRAMENALGIVPSEQTVLLRKLMVDSETIQSHILHTYFLVAPDFFNAPSVLPLAATHTDVVLRALRLKKLANEMGAVIGGRPVHPISMVLNGFTQLPTVRQLKDLRQKLADALPDLEATVDLFSTLTLPAFERETEYIALKSPAEYAFYDGDIASTDGGLTPVSDYLSKIKEHVVQHSTAKHAKAARQSYAVGALARINNNYSQLLPMAKRAAEKLGYKPISYNPFMNNIAQVIETAHAFESSLNIIDELLSRGIKEEDRRFEIRAGRGVGAVEVPRGLLIHDYTVDEKGIIQAANCIIPTNQNFANLDDDIRAIVPELMDKPKEEVTHLLEMLVRSYDPCISCAVHLIDLTGGRTPINV